MENLTQLRVDLLRQMHNTVIDLGDDDMYEEWVTYGVPDQPCTEDFFDIANDNELWNDVIALFGKVMQIED